MNNYILPIPFQMGPYGLSKHVDSLPRVLSVAGASDIAAQYDPSDIIKSHAIVLPAVGFDATLPNDLPEEGEYIRSVYDMQINTGNAIRNIFDDLKTLVVFGGDHSVAIGTGYGLSQCVDMSKVGLIWIDAHGDCNIPEISLSKSVTGYPAAINCGLGSPLLVNPFGGNTIKNLVHIGLRDVDEQESRILSHIGSHVFSAVDIEEQGFGTVIAQALELLADCEMIWLSCDIDSLDPIYLQPGETDVPVVGGLTPRELIYAFTKIQSTGKLKVAEIVQVNDIGTTTPVTVLSSRLIEIALGVGGFRYGKS